MKGITKSIFLNYEGSIPKDGVYVTFIEIGGTKYQVRITGLHTISPDVINDELASLVTTYSSTKIEQLLQDIEVDINDIINDSITTTDKTWSSSKISQELLEARGEYFQINGSNFEADNITYLNDELAGKVFSVEYMGRSDGGGSFDRGLLIPNVNFIILAEGGFELITPYSVEDQDIFQISGVGFLPADTAGKQNLSEKNQPNGYTGLDSNSKVPINYLPTYNALDRTTEGAVLDARQAKVLNDLKQNKFIINVRDYGAVGDGITDDSSAIMAAHNALPVTGGTLFFPNGKYFTHGGLVFTKEAIRLEGENGSYTFNYTTMQTDIVGTIIESDSQTNTLLTITSPGAVIENLTILNTASLSPTSGVGLSLPNAGFFSLINSTIAEFYINMEVDKGAFWIIDKSRFFNPVLYNLKLNNTTCNDCGDNSISNSSFASNSVSQVTNIKWESGGGLRITSCKFNPAFGGRALTHIDGIAPNSGQLQVSNSSLEGFTGYGIRLHTPYPGFAYTLINNNYFSPLATMTGHCISLEIAPISVVTGNIFSDDASNTQSAINLLDSSYQVVLSNTFYSWTNKVTSSNVPFSQILTDTPISLIEADAKYTFSQGVTGGQTIRGDKNASGDLTLTSTLHATKGRILFGLAGLSAFNETNNRLGIGTGAPLTDLEISKQASAAVGGVAQVSNPATSASGNAVEFRLAPTSSPINRFAAIRGTQDGSNSVTLDFYTNSGGTYTSKLKISPTGVVSLPVAPASGTGTLLLLVRNSTAGDIQTLSSIPPNLGGTGITSYSAGDFITALNATTLQKRTPAQVLSDIGAAPTASPTFTGTTKIAVAEYADNAAAVTAGLTVGSVYRTGDLLKIVH